MKSDGKNGLDKTGDPEPDPPLSELKHSEPEPSAFGAEAIRFQLADLT